MLLSTLLVLETYPRLLLTPANDSYRYFLLLIVVAFARSVSGQQYQCEDTANQPEPITLWRRVDPETPINNQRYGPGIVDEPPEPAPTSLGTYKCPGDGTNMVPSGNVANPEDFIKIVNLAPDGSHVELEVFQGFTTGDIPFVALQKTDVATGSVSCSPSEASPVPTGSLVMRVNAKCDMAQKMSTVTVYAGSPGSSVAAGCAEVPGVTMYTFNLPCTCPEVVTTQSVPNPPVAVDDTTSTLVNTPVDVSVLDNDSDPDGDQLTVVDTTPSAQGGTCAIAGDMVTYTYVLHPVTIFKICPIF